MRDIWDLIINNFIGCLIVFFRVTGIFTFNPIFGRQTVPMRIRVLASLALSIAMLASMGGTVGYIPGSVFDLAAVLLKEAAVGLIFGMITNLILTVIIYAGEIIDNQSGLSMAKVMDPSTGIQMPVFGNVMNYMFLLYFFITGGHLSYIKLFATSYQTLPIGYEFGTAHLNAAYAITQYLGTSITLAVKLAMPVIAAELITEMCMGIMMKAVPTIQVFVVNIQLKIIVGLLVLMSVAGPISNFLENLLDIMWENLFGTLNML